MTWAVIVAWIVIKTTQRLQHRKIAAYMLSMRDKCENSDQSSAANPR